MSRMEKKLTGLRGLGSVSVFRWNLLSWTQSIELVSVPGPTQLSKFLLKMWTESSLRNVMF
jgi:hypothetical protein